MTFSVAQPCFVFPDLRTDPDHILASVHSSWSRDLHGVQQVYKEQDRA